MRDKSYWSEVAIGHKEVVMVIMEHIIGGWKSGTFCTK